MEPLLPIPIADVLNLVQNFAKQDLPKNHQIVEPGSFNTMDHNKDRLKVHVGEDGIVRYVTRLGTSRE